MSRTVRNENRLLVVLARIANLAILIALGALVAPACDTGDEDDVNKGNNGDTDTGTGTDTSTDAGTDTSADAGTDSGTDSEEPEYTTALVITTDYQAGAYSTIALDGHAVTQDINSIHSDSVCDFDSITETPFIIQRLSADSVLVLDPVTFDVENEYSVTASSNPHDIEFVSAEKAYITRYGLAEMLIVSPLTGAEIGTVDLSSYADADGIPEVSGMGMMDGKIYAAVMRLDRENSWEPVGESYLVIIDAATGQVSGDIQLTGTHPVGAPEYSEALGKFVVAEVGSYGTLDDGGVELLDPATGTMSGFVVTETALGGSVNKTLCVSETKCYAIIGVAGDNGSNTHLVTFDPQTGQMTGTLAETEGWSYGDIALTPDNSELWLADRTSENAGIRIFDAATDAETTAAPIDVGLPPGDICFTR